MVSTKITRQRMENQLVSTKIIPQGLDSTKITHQRDGWDGELNGQHENNSPKDGESISKHENKSPKGWTVQK